METEYVDVRNWLLDSERYEDVTKFDSLNGAKEQYCVEFKNTRPECLNLRLTDNKTIPKMPETNNAEILTKHIHYLEEIIKIKIDVINILNKRFNP